MPQFSLELKLNLENLTKLSPAGDDFRWYLKLKCSNCGEQPDHWQYLTSDVQVNVQGSRCSANLVEKCKLCGRQNQIDVLKDSIQPYRIEKNGEWQKLVSFECRGLEPTDFDPRIGWVAEGAESGTQFADINLSEKEWCEYDERAALFVGIYEWEHRFVRR